MGLKKVGIVATPESVEALHEWINLHTGPERIIAYTAAFMAWNLAAELTKPRSQCDQKGEGDDLEKESFGV